MIKTNKPPNSAFIHNISFKREFTYDNSNVLTMSVEYPYVFLPQKPQAQANINNKISLNVKKFFNYNISKLFPDAIKNYNSQIENNYPLIPYESQLVYTTTYNKNCYLSMYNDEYYFTAGAHGNTTRKSDTFSIITGRNIPLSHFFKNNPRYKTFIIEQIILQANNNIKDNPGIYFEDYPTLIKNNFNENNYYLSENGIVFYFQQYDIGPYSSGIIQFTIDYNIVPNPPKC